MLGVLSNRELVVECKQDGVSKRYFADGLGGEHIGVALKSSDADALVNGLQPLLQVATVPATRARCVAAELKHFSLDEAIAGNNDIYDLING